MPTPLARGTLTGQRVPGPATAAAQPEGPSVMDLAAMTTAAKVEHLLIPQHVALRAAVAALRSTAHQLARLEAEAAPALRRVVAVVDDLATALMIHLDHEERALFPSLIASRAVTDAVAAIHEHHDAVATRLRWLQLLAADVRTSAGITPDTMVLFAGMATLTRLFQRHRELERWVVLAAAGARPAQPARAPVTLPRPRHP